MSDAGGHGGDPMNVELVRAGGGFADGPSRRGVVECWEVAIKTAGDPDIRLAAAWDKAEAVEHAISRIETMLAGLRNMKQAIQQEHDNE